MSQSNDDPHTDTMPDIDMMKNSRQRGAVCAESHDPEKSLTQNRSTIPTYQKSELQRKFLTNECSQCCLFKQLDKSDLNYVVNAMQEVKVTEGKVVIRQGDEGDCCYVIQKGIFEAWVTTVLPIKRESEIPEGSTKVKEYRDQGMFGELSIMYSTPRAATVIAKTNGVIWALDRVAYQRMVLDKVYQRRVNHVKFLSSVTLLKELKPNELMKVAEALIVRSYKNGERIIEEGSPGEEMYFVEKGVVAIRCRETSNAKQTNVSKPAEKEITRIKENGYFGEMALINKQPRAASAYAVGAVQLAVLDVASFERLLGTCNSLMRSKIKSYDSLNK